MFCNCEVGIDPVARNIVDLCALKSYPAECCGFLWGLSGVITVAKEVNNISECDKLRYFEIHASAFIAAEDYAEINGLTLMGAFHSHPDAAAEPSDTDLKSALPNFLYMIVSVRDHLISEARLWILDDHRTFQELRMHNVMTKSSNQ